MEERQQQGAGQETDWPHLISLSLSLNKKSTEAFSN